MAKQNEGVRIGPISLVTLISVLLLAVLAMLCVTTANATRTMADRQAASVAETYQLDACGQALLAGVNTQVAGTASAADAAAAVSGQLPQLQQQALSQANGQDVQISAKVEGATVVFTAALPSGKALNGAIALNENGTASISEWKLSTTQQETEQALWSGSSGNQ